MKGDSMEEAEKKEDYVYIEPKNEEKPVVEEPKVQVEQPEVKPVIEEKKHEPKHHHTTHHHKHHIPKSDANGVWMFLTLILGVALIASLVLGGGGESESIGAEVAGAEAVDYANKYLLRNEVQARLITAQEKSGFYEVVLDIAGDQITSYVTRDGTLFFPQAFDLTKAPEMPAPATEVVEAKPVDELTEAVKGNVNAPITIIEYSEYQCPFCGKFVKETLPSIVTEYIATGKVRYVFRDFPLTAIHPHAQKAAEATHCAGEQEKFWDMHDKLFDNQQALTIENLKSYAGELSLDQAAFDTCLDTGKFAGKVKDNLVSGQQAGITGTPGFIINGKKLAGALPFAAFKQVIDEELAKIEG